jgi:aspartate/methionine/tyrosine aminotransferase
MSVSFQPFEMERLMSKWENVIDYNLSESGVHPMTLRELISDPDEIERLLCTEINYPQANGLPELRERIAALYPGSTPDNVLVTVGCIEANYLALYTLLEPGDEIAIMSPNYMQIWGVAKNMGLSVNPFYLKEDLAWSMDLGKTVSEKTRLIAVCNPNNPTGHIMTEKEMDAVVAEAESVGAWLLADEVYAGAERLTDRVTPSLWGKYDRVLAMGSLSKAYGLPGLRIGWVVGPADTVDEMWARHEYLAISTTMLSNKLATVALSPDVRPRILKRTRKYIRDGYSILEGWINDHSAIFDVVPPQAAAIAFVRYNFDINSSVLIKRFMDEKSVFVIPGDHFGLDHHLRISFGLPPDLLSAGLDRIGEVIVELQK